MTFRSRTVLIPSRNGERVSQFLRVDEKPKRAYGDPTFGTAANGELMLDAVADSLAEVVRDIQSGKF